MAEQAATQSTPNTVKLEVNDPRRFFCDQAFIVFNSEHFVLGLQSGTVIDNQYVFTPKHMKRVFMRLKEQLDKYEKENGEIVTSLPEQSDDK